MRVADPAKFMSEIVGTDGEFTSDEISFQIRNIIVQEFSRVIASSGIPVLDMAANTQDMGKIVASAITPAITAYGLSIPEFYIENVSLPEAVEAALDKRTSMGIVGDLNRYMQYNAAEALARGDGGAAGAAMGAGMGAGIGMAMGARVGPWGAPPEATTAAPPPPPPPLVEKVWHIAENGAAQGPYGRGHLGRLVADGSLTRETLVWAQGMDGWKPAGEVTELAQLFTVMPPPPPGA
jgi:hypothetical protein